MYFINHTSRINNIIDNIIVKTDSDKLGLLFSFVLHLSIVVISLGIPSCFQEKTINVPQIIPIEILTIDDITNIPTELEKLENNESKKEMKKKEVKFSGSEQTEITKIQDTLENEIIDEKSEIIPEIEENEVELKVDLKPQIEEKKEKKPEFESLPSKKIKPKIKPKPIKNEDKSESIDIAVKIKQKPKPVFDISSVLKDIRNESVQINEKIEEDDEDEKIDQSEENKDNNSNTFTINEMDLLKQQLYGCYTVPAGIKKSKDMQVKVRVWVNPDKTVMKARILDTNKMQNDPRYRTVAESALRAVLNPACSPLKLPSGKYELWKKFVFVFDLDWMLGN